MARNGKKLALPVAEEAAPVAEVVNLTANVDGVNQILNDVLTANHLVEESPVAVVEDDLAPAGAPVVVAESTWSAAKAAPYYFRTTNYLLAWGTIDKAKKERLNALIKDLETHGEVFSAQIALLAYELSLMLPKAKRNFERLLTAETFGYMEANKAWMECVFGVAERLKGVYSSALPGEVGFDPQVVITDLERDNLHRVVSALTEISRFSTCRRCGKWVGFSKADHNPFTDCQDCRKAEKEAEELADLNLKLAEKNILLAPLEELLIELSAAASFWVSDEEKRGWTKAQVAFDNAFKSTIEWHIKRVAEMKVSIVTGKITDADRAAVEAEKGFLLKVIEEVRTFKHLTYCRECFMPTYPKAGDRASKPCDDCGNRAKQAASHPAVEDVEVLEEAAREAGIGLELNGRHPVHVEEVAPAFDLADKFEKAWERRKAGKEKEKGKGKGKKK